MTPVNGAIEPHGTAEREPSPRRRSVLRTIGILLGSVVGAAVVVFLGGFALFTARIANHEPSALKPADAIVVLTGGASRVADGVQLLAEGRGQRLLISGVNRTTSTEELRRTLPIDETLLDCCVDLGKKALNTWGNAIEAAEWVRTKQFRSLVVVTSAWHMPRALFELGRALPDVELIAYPVVTDRMQDTAWWSKPETTQLLLKEYVKYVLAYAKIRPLQAVIASERPAGSREQPQRHGPGPQASAH